MTTLKGTYCYVICSDCKYDSCDDCVELQMTDHEQRIATLEDMDATSRTIQKYR